MGLEDVSLDIYNCLKDYIWFCCISIKDNVIKIYVDYRYFEKHKYNKIVTRYNQYNIELHKYNYNLPVNDAFKSGSSLKR